MITEIRQKLEDLAREHSREAHGREVNAYSTLDKGLTTPCFIVPVPVGRPAAMGGGKTQRYEFEVACIAARGSHSDTTAKWLEQQLDPVDGFEAAVSADRTLDGLVELAWVSERRPLDSSVELDGVALAGAVLMVMVIG